MKNRRLQWVRECSYGQLEVETAIVKFLELVF